MVYDISVVSSSKGFGRGRAHYTIKNAGLIYLGDTYNGFTLNVTYHYYKVCAKNVLICSKITNNSLINLIVDTINTQKVISWHLFIYNKEYYLVCQTS